jgi:hypothetical protein
MTLAIDDVLHEPLPDDPRPRRAKRQPYRHLVPAMGCPREHDVRHVHARDQQEASDHREEDGHDEARVMVQTDLLGQRQYAHTPVGVGLWIGFAQPARYSGELTPRLFDGVSGSETTDAGQRPCLSVRRLAW